MLAYAKERLLDTQANVELLQIDAQHLEFPDRTFDTVVSTCVFCSVPDPVKGLQEIRRVLKLSGRLLMIEHMLSDHSLLALGLHAMNPLAVRISGANVNRRTMQNLETAGFTIQDVQMVAFKDIIRIIVAIPKQ